MAQKKLQRIKKKMLPFNTEVIAKYPFIIAHTKLKYFDLNILSI